VEAAVLAHVRGMRVEASERRERVESALERLRATEGELAAYRDSEAASILGAVGYADGLRPRAAAVEAASRELALARSGVTLPDPEAVEGVWDRLPVESKRRILRDTLGVVWVRKGRANIADRVRIILRGFEPPDLPGHNGAASSTLRPLDWRDKLLGELRLKPGKLAR